MAELFGRQISLIIAADPGADPGEVAAVRKSVKGKGFMYSTKDEAFKKLKELGLQPFGYFVWKFSNASWGLVTRSEIKRLQGPAEVQGKQFNQFRVSFRIKRTSDGKPNKATVQLFNPNPDTIASVQERSAIVRVMAGYDFPWMLFQGNPVKDGVNIERGGPDRVLKLELQDSGFKLRNTRLSLNFSTNTTVKQALRRIAKESELAIGFVDDVDDVDLPYGMRIDGSPAQALQRIADVSGGDFSIQDGAIQVIKTSNDTGEPAVKFSTQNGNLLSVARKEKGRIEVTAMLEGSIRPGRRFVVESELINGIFKAIDVEHAGDLFDNNFTTKITARPWKAPSPAPARGSVASIKAASEAQYGLFPSLPAAQARAQKIDLKFAVEAGNLFIAKFADGEFGLIAKGDVKKLRDRGIAVYEAGFVGPVQ